MNQYNGLLSAVARQYGILRGTNEEESEWKTRLIYSICGMMAYASLWDDSEETVSIIHLKRKVKNILSNYKSIMLTITVMCFGECDRHRRFSLNVKLFQIYIS